MILLFGAIAACTFLLRALFIVKGTTARFDVLARYLPIAALTALITPSVLLVDAHPGYARFVAAAAGAIVAVRFRNVALTVAAGMGVLIAIQAF